VWQIKNATQRTNRLLEELIALQKGMPKKTRHDITGLIGDKDIER
jgi:hypothetical protein